VSDAQAHALIAAVLIILPLSALLARRVPLGHTARMAAAWVAIFAAGLLVITAVQSRGATWSAIMRALGLSDQSVVGRTVQIPIGEDGHFSTTVSIDGISARMMIDTGASVTSLSTATARAAGLDLGEEDFPAMVDTANGSTLMRVSTVKSLKLGTIEAKRLKVLVGDNMTDGNVIGMNFLSRLKSWRVEGNRMILEPGN